MSAHTPGPWTAEHVGNTSAGDDGIDVYEVLSERSRICEYASEADAILISAAPDLFAALWIAEFTLSGMAGAGVPQALETIRAAIAKATGAQ